MNRLLPFAFVLLSTAVRGSTESNGPNGIDSIATGLDGTGIPIGQGEVNRSAKFGYDTMAEFVASNTIPTGVYRQTDAGMDDPNPDAFLLDHATEVAG